MEKLFKWRLAVASKLGPKSPTTRHILLTISLHMDVAGSQCFPSTDTIAEETGLSRRTVCIHLEKAVAEGWISKGVRGMGVKGWWRHSYQAEFPAKVVSEAPNLITQGCESDAQGCESDDVKVVSEAHTSSSYNSTKNSTKTYSPNSDEFRLSALLLDLIIRRNPKHKKPDLQKWARHIDLAIRRDHRTPDEVERVIRWCQTDSFWQNNILSTDKLRKQFDQLWMKMQEENYATKPTGCSKSGKRNHNRGGAIPGKYDGIGQELPATG